MVNRLGRHLAARLEIRLSFMVVISLLLLSLLAGLATYFYAYQHEQSTAQQWQEQLLAAVQSQAEVAAFAANADIALGVLEGLVASDLIVAARIESFEGFEVQVDPPAGLERINLQQFPLFSPLSPDQTIGLLTIAQDQGTIEAIAVQAALRQTILLVAQVFLTAIIIILVLRQMVIRPTMQLAHQMVMIEPGSSQRLRVSSQHQRDELGMLAHSANAFLDAAEAAFNEVKAQSAELERLATHDHLTGLPSLRLAEDRLEQACEMARRQNTQVALMFLDLDGFKQVNDEYGHATGDDVLREAAQRIKAVVRDEDTVARIGGDEFVVVLSRLPDGYEAARAAQAIIESIARPIVLDGVDHRVGVSIGIAIFPTDANHPVELRRMADEAMYAAKEAGKGRSVFYAAMADSP